MSTHVIVGAGAIGSATARLLSERGERVLLISRSGAGPDLPGVRLVRADASDTAALTDLTRGAAVLYNCASPAYHLWATDWPPLAAALLDAAQHSGAVLATVSNLYGYGQVTAPMTEDTPLRPHGPKGRVRVQMWRDALAMHEAELVRVTEVRSSDYIGPNSHSQLGDRIVPRVLAGKSVQVLRSADTPHSWTYVQDVARLLAIVGNDDRAWGRAWHVPSNAPRTQRDAINDLARIAAVEPVKVGEVSAAPVVNGIAGPLRFLFNNPFQRLVLDSVAVRVAVADVTGDDRQQMDQREVEDEVEQRHLPQDERWTQDARRPVVEHPEQQRCRTESHQQEQQ